MCELTMISWILQKGEPVIRECVMSQGKCKTFNRRLRWKRYDFYSSMDAQILMTDPVYTATKHCTICRAAVSALS